MTAADRNQALHDVLATVRPVDLMRAVPVMERNARRAYEHLTGLPASANPTQRAMVRGRAERSLRTAKLLRRLAAALEQQAPSQSGEEP